MDDDTLARLRALRADLGTAALAEELGIPAPSLRRVLSTGHAGGATLGKIEALLGEDEAEEEYESDDDEVNEYAELWGVSPAEAEALRDELGDEFEFGGMTRDELREYIDDLYDVLTEEGWDLDVSDLWDMYYGYAPGAK